MSTSAESPLTAASHKASLIRTSDISTSPSSSSPPPNDRDADHVFYNPCNSARASSFFSSNSTDLYNSSNTSVNDSTLDESHETTESYYTNYSRQQDRKLKSKNSEFKEPFHNSEVPTQHSTNILIRYHNGNRPSSSLDDGSPPTPVPRSSIISSVLSSNSSTHIVQSYTPAYANTYFSSSPATLQSNSSNQNSVGIPTFKASANSNTQYNSINSPVYPNHGNQPHSNQVGGVEQNYNSSDCKTNLMTLTNLQPTGRRDLKFTHFSSNVTDTDNSYDENCARRLSNLNVRDDVTREPTSCRDYDYGLKNGPHQSENSWDNSKSNHAWSNSLGRGLAVRPSHGIQVRHNELL